MNYTCPNCHRRTHLVNGCGCDPNNVPTVPCGGIVRRLFSALNHPAGSDARKRLNLDAFTSEYLPSHKYLVKIPFPNHPTQRHLNHTLRTKTEALAYLVAQMEAK